MKFLYSSNNTREIKKLFEHKDEIKCAVSFWGGDASKYISGDKHRVKIICNLESGATNPYLIESLIADGVSIKSNSKLHSKVYMAGRDIAIVGSSNASANGLSFEGVETNGWLEASVLINEKEVISDIDMWFQTEWKVASNISDSMLKSAKKKWAKRRNDREIQHDEETSLLTTLKNSPEYFKDKNIYISIYREPEASEKAVELFEQAKKELNIENKLTFWEAWSELPEDSFFVSLYYGPRGRFSFEGYYYVPKDKVSYTEKLENESGEILICFTESSIEGKFINDEDIKLLKENIDDLWRSANPISKNDGVFLSLWQAGSVLYKNIE